MNAETFTKILGADFYTGVPDSQLRPLCDCLMRVYGTDPRRHVIAANEGNAAALALLLEERHRRFPTGAARDFTL